MPGRARARAPRLLALSFLAPSSVSQPRAPAGVQGLPSSGTYWLLARSVASSSAMQRPIAEASALPAAAARSLASISSSCLSLLNGRNQVNQELRLGVDPTGSSYTL